MAEVFLSYERSNAVHAQRVGDAIRSLGYRVWLDEQLPAHRTYASVIEERLQAATAVVVIWSEAAIKSEWVRSEANRGREDKKLVQLRIESARLPMPFDQIQCADMSDWTGDLAAPGWRKVADSLAELSGSIGREAQPVPLARQNSVCVLPFANMSGDAEQEYFSDGISEDIITDLSKVSALFVIARNTAFTFKGKNVDVQQVARQLNVSYVLEGSVRKAGPRVRITAQLIDGNSGGHVWAERYDRDLNDIFAVQDEISAAIVSALKLKLLPEEKAKIERRATENVEAYQRYLLAKSLVYQNTRESLDAAENHTRYAIELDPSYADPWAQLASIMVIKTEDGFFPSKEGYERVRELALRALALNPNLADAQACLIDVYRALDRDWVAAEEQTRLALAMDPTNTNTRNAAALLMITLGRWDDAERHLREALARDPLNSFLTSNLGNAYYGAGRFAEAERTHRSLKDLAPDFFWTHVMLARLFLVTGRPEEALVELEEEPREDVRLLALPTILDALGRTSEANSALQAQIAVWKDSHPMNVAVTYARRGDADAAFQWLERAYESYDTNLLEMIGERLLFEPIAHDPRYQAFMNKMRLPLMPIQALPAARE